MEDHNGWGNRVDWCDFETRRVDGHMTPIPEVGDRIISKMESGKRGVFEIISVKRGYNTTDQFFATVKDIGLEDGTRCWFCNNQKELDKLNEIWEKAVVNEEIEEE
jgi:hypothetical protein